MNHLSLRRLLLLIILLVVILPVGRARADLGPKPTVEFAFEQAFEGEPVTIVSGILMQCDQPDCADAHPLPENMGPQHFTCEGLTCSGLAYGFTDYGQLKITFSDGKVRQSNVFAITNFNAHYDVTINKNDLVVKERISPVTLSLAIVCLCCCCGMVLIVLITVIIVVARRKKGL